MDNLEIYKNGKVVGLIKQEADVTGREDVLFGEIEVLGDIEGEVQYKGQTIRIYYIEEMDAQDEGRRRIWKGVIAQQIRPLR